MTLARIVYTSVLTSLVGSHVRDSWAACRDKQSIDIEPRGRFFLDIPFYRTSAVGSLITVIECLSCQAWVLVLRSQPTLQRMRAMPVPLICRKISRRKLEKRTRTSSGRQRPLRLHVRQYGPTVAQSVCILLKPAWIVAQLPKMAAC
jgi:hypothetical protein